MHLHQHAFQDILEKGATRNFNTKINENLHGPIKDIYDNILNGKNVDERVSNNYNSNDIFFMTTFFR